MARADLCARSLLRGGIGIFYDTLPGLLAQDFSSNPPLVNSFTIIKDALTPNEITNLFKDAAASNISPDGQEFARHALEVREGGW